MAAVLVWQLGGGEGEAADLADLPGVRETADEDGGLLVTFDPGARVDQVEAALDRDERLRDGTLSWRP